MARVNTMDFSQSVKKHLEAYRRDVLGVKENGLWRSKEYGHIIPKCFKCLNILDGVRSEFFHWLPKSEMKLHAYFHHLNSSQAACINLFFPPARLERDRVVLALLGLSDGNITKWQFEKVMDRKERTNFDFYLELESGSKVYVEFKYSENEFGKAQNDERHQDKLKNIYKPKLTGKVAAEYLKEPQFFENYQLLRNLVYFRPERGDCVVFMYPKGNDKLSFLLDRLDDMIPDKNIRNAVKTRHLEDAVNDATEVLGPDDNLLRNHFRQYKEKYLSLVMR